MSLEATDPCKVGVAWRKSEFDSRSVHCNETMVSADHVLDWASTIAARVVKLNVEHHKIKLDGLYNGILEALYKPLPFI